MVKRPGWNSLLSEEIAMTKQDGMMENEEYSGLVDEKAAFEQKMRFKDRRVTFWEKHRTVATATDLAFAENLDGLPPEAEHEA